MFGLSRFNCKNNLNNLKNLKVVFLDKEFYYEEIFDDEELIRSIGVLINKAFDYMNKFREEKREINCFEMTNFVLSNFISSTNFKKNIIELKGDLIGDGKCMPKSFRYRNHYLPLLSLRDNFYMVFDFTIKNFSDNYCLCIFVDSQADLEKALKKIYSYEYLKFEKF